MSLQTYLAKCEGNYSPEHNMLGNSLQSPGYHTRLADGTWVHPTRQALDYALALLETGQDNYLSRAHQVIRKVLSLQETDPTTRTYGIWPWFLEESLTEMAPPDWNWADFCGARLLQMLIEQALHLPADLVQAIRDSVGHAAWSIFRRNVQPGYTNIAIMGAGVTLAAGELLNEPRLLDYGRRRLHNIIDHTTYHGGFNEYNSPTYTIVALEECERILQLVQDPAARSDADTIRHLAWQTLANHFHPATAQWAGPHSRTYQDYLRLNVAHLLRETTGLTIPLHPTLDTHNETDYSPLKHLPCPADLISRFQSLPQAPLLIRQRFIRRETAERATWGTTWFDQEACLGTVNYDSMWTQRRGLLGYWRTADDPAVVLRLRFLHDGQDFASAGGRNIQQDNRVLSAINLLTNKGDYHLHLDRPEDGLFRAEDFRIRYELIGQGVSGRQLDTNRFELAAGDYRAVIHPLAGRFGPESVSWRIGQMEERVYLDGVCYQGKQRSFDLAAITPVILAAGLELLGPDQTATTAPLQQADQSNGRYEVSWSVVSSLKLVVPKQAEAYWD